MHADPNSPYSRSPATSDSLSTFGHISQDLAAMDRKFACNCIYNVIIFDLVFGMGKME